MLAPGVVFADDDVVPDVAWISRDRLVDALDEDTLTSPLLPGFALELCRLFVPAG